MLGLLDLVLAPGVVEAQHRDAVLIHHVGVDLAVITLQGNAFPAPGEAHVGAVEAPVVIFQGGPVAAGGLHLAVLAGVAAVHPLYAEAEAVGGHAHAAAVLDVVAAGKVQLLVL